MDVIGTNSSAQNLGVAIVVAITLIPLIRNRDRPVGRTALGRVTNVYGPLVVGLATGVILVGGVFIEVVGYQASIEGRTRSPLAAGASVYSVSAVLIIARSIDSNEADIGYAAGTVLLFNAVTLVVFPVLGSMLGLPDRAFGVWAG